MASVMEIVVRAQDLASNTLEQVGEAGAQAGSWVEENWVKVTAAGAAAGTALEGLARKQAPLTEGTRRLAARLGENEDAVRGWGQEISNVTFPLASAVNLMEEAARQGLRSKEDIQAFASTWDTVGDATGENADQLASAGVALRGVGIAAGDETKALDAFGFITDNTTGSISEFLQFLDKAGPDLRDMGADVNDAAAILGVLENELGMSGRTARMEFRQGVTAAEGDMNKLLETLGVSSEQFEQYKTKVGESSDVIQRNADIHATSYTWMQKLQHSASELMHRYGGLIEGASGLAVPLIALGPVSKGVQLGLAGVGRASRAVRAAFTAEGAAAKALALAKRGLALATNVLGKAMAFLAANPIVLVIVAVAALAAGIVLLWRHSETFRTVVLAVWGAVQRAIRAAWRNAIEPAWKGILSGIDALKRGTQAFGQFWDRVWEGIKATPRAAGNAIIGVLNAVIAGYERVGNAIAGAVNAIPDFNIPSWVPGIGGRSFGLPNVPRVSLPRIPSFHTGGVFRAPPGRREGLATLLDNELIVNPDGTVTSGGGFDEVADLLREMIRLLREALGRPAIAHVSVDELGSALVDRVRRTQGL